MALGLDAAGLRVNVHGGDADLGEPYSDELAANEWAATLWDQRICSPAELRADRADGLELTIEFAVDGSVWPA